MHGLLAQRHAVATAIGQRIFYRPIFLNAGALLVKHQHGQIFAQTHIPAIGRQFAKQHIQQSRFARTVGADKADTRAALDEG